jgi:CheY-like chemotaxis protein
MPIRPKILIADDEPVIADTLATILNQRGFESRAVYSGEGALEVASTFLPDMLVTDVIMADLNGIETAIKMRSLLPHIKVLLFSGEAASADLLLQANARGYEFEILAKPVHPVDLFLKLEPVGADSVFQPTQSESPQSVVRKQWIDVAPTDRHGQQLATPSEDN